VTVRHRIAILLTAFIVVPAVVNAQTVTATWDASPPADAVTTYDVCIGTSMGSCNVRRASVPSPQVSLPFTPVGGVMNYVAVRANNAKGAGPYSAPVGFSIPSLAQPSNQTSPVGVAITPLTLAVSDPDGSALTFMHTGLPVGLSINSATRRITGTPAAAGSYNVAIFVTDGLATISRSFTWTITSTSSDRTAPALTILSHRHGQTVTTPTVTISGTASDGSGGSGIRGVTVNGQMATGGTATGSGTANWSRSITLSSGSNAVTVQAVDGAGNVNMQQITLNLAAATTSTVTSATIATNLASPQITGSSVTFSGTGSGGVAPYQYKFLLQQGSGSMQTVRNWSTTATYIWTPTTAASYTMTVWVRSAGVTTDAPQASARMAYTVNAPTQLRPWAESGTANTADVNGDGKIDLLMQDFTNAFWLSLSTGPGYARPYVVVRHGGAYNPDGAHIADVNGDGRADLLMQGFDNRFWLSLSTGTGFTYPILVLQHGGPFNPEGAHIADVNGDGRADVLMQGFDNRFWVSLSTGSGFTAPVSVLQHGGSFNPDGTHIADVNGDRRADVLFQAFDNRFWLSLSTTQGYTTPTPGLKHGGSFNPNGAHIADVNGDRRADVLFQAFDNRFWLSLSTGSGFTAPVSALKHGGSFNPYGAHIVDVNGDGRADVLMQGFDNRFWLSLSTGSGFTSPVSVLKHGGAFNPHGAHLVDVNGDGRADVLFQSSDNSFWLSLSTGSGFTSPARVL
jgi:hypothetical protein